MQSQGKRTKRNHWVLMIEEGGVQGIAAAADIPAARRVLLYEMQYDSGRLAETGR